MPRTSRHKSSKHSSRDYSDSEKDASSKDRKSKEESSSRVTKESGSGEKRKLESKENKESLGSGNGDYVEEYSSSKRRKERVEDGVNDRWNGGGDDRGEGIKRLKEKSGESKSKRRDEIAGLYGESEEVVKKNSGKSEGKHRESTSRKEGRDGGVEREREKEKERRGKEGKSERFVDGDDLRAVKQVSEKRELNARDPLQSPNSDNLLDGRIRRKQDGFGDGDKHQDDLAYGNGRRLSSKEDVAKDGRQKDEKHKDERYRDKYREDVDRENRHRDDKQRDERNAKDHTNSRSDDKHLRDDKDATESKPKKHKPQDGEGENEREREHDHDHEFDFGQDHDRESYQRDRDRDRDHNRGRERERDRERARERDREHDRDWDRDRDREHDRDRDGDRNLEYDGVHIGGRSARYKDSRARKRSSDDYDDAKSRGVKTPYHDMGNKSLSSTRVESDTDRGRSQSRQAHPDSNISSKRASPSASSHVAADEHRQLNQELKYRDTAIAQRSKPISSRDGTGLPDASDRASKYRSNEKSVKVDDGHIGELLVERSSSSKASPMGLVDRSPSSTSLERRYMNRSGVRRSLDIEESGRRSSASMGTRDLPSADDRPSRDLPLEKSLADEDDSSFYTRNSQSNSSFIPPSSALRSRHGSPSFLCSLEEDNRINSGTRYKRSSDPNLGRGQGNAWRGAPNWSSPIPNGYIPFQHGPPHGGFQAMMPQFPSPPLFGVRPSMEINHSGIPYHIPDADRFPSHLRPLGWQNMMDISGPSHMHGWDGNNGLFRDESHLYGGPEWDQSRHPMDGRGWESSADIWKGKNGDVNMDLPSTSMKEDFPVQAPVEDVSAGHESQRSQNEINHHGIQAKGVETKLAIFSSVKMSAKSSPRTTPVMTPEPASNLADNDTTTHLYHAYLSNLDISTELADQELHSQFMSLLNIEPSATVDEDVPMLVNLKDGARAVSKSSETLLSSSFFPVASNTIFQRAMDIYKRQRVGLSSMSIANGGRINVISASKIEEQVPVNDIDVVEDPVINHNTKISNVQMLNLDDNKVESVLMAAVHENLEATTTEVVVDIHTVTHDPKLEPPVEAVSHYIAEKPSFIFSGDKVDGSESADSEDPRRGSISTPYDMPNSAANGPAADVDNIADEIDKTKGSNNSFNFAEEGKGKGDEKCGPLFISDGSLQVSGNLISESNESELVIISRIHHSPESTH